jgi:hypothetical protein
MIRKKTFFYISLLLIFSTVSFAQQLVTLSTISVPKNEIEIPTISSAETKDVIVDTVKTAIDTVTALPQKKSFVYPPPFKDYRRLGYNTSIYFATTVVAFSGLWVMPQRITNWNKAEMREKGIFWKWKENVKTGPVMDDDKWQLNYIAHPYCGGLYYMTARSSGFSVLESFGYSVIMSTFFWEYGIESFAEAPSTQDLIITPILGSVVGEGFFYAKKSIVKHNHKILKSKFLGYTALLFMDPFNTILDGFGYKEKVKTQMNIAPVGFDTNANKTVWGVQFSASF